MAGAPAALGATTVGQLPTPSGSCPANYAQLQTSVASGNSYTVPSPGVITSWSFQAGATSATLKLKVGRAQGGGNYLIVGESTVESAPANKLSTFSTRISVAAGDLIGLTSPNGDSCAAPGADPSDKAIIGPNDTPPNTSAPFTTPANVRLDIAAQLEADADGDGFGDESQDQCFTDPSTQGPCPVPTVTGSARTGQTLTAAANGAPMNPAYQWLRCDGGGAGCLPIPGATFTSYLVGPADVGHTLRFRKAATNSSGTQVSESAPTAAVILSPVVPVIVPVVLAPGLSGLLLSPSSFRAAPNGPSATAAKKKKRKLGTVISYRDSQAARTSFTVLQSQNGVRKGKRCVKARRKPAKAKKQRRCKRLVALGSFTHTDRAGNNRLRFTGRVRGKKLKPGHYQLRAVAQNSSRKTSRPATSRFQIKR